jgi:hypothetical protein
MRSTPCGRLFDGRTLVNASRSPAVAVAALAILDGLPSAQAVSWVRARYHHRAVETPWQRRWLRRLA